VIVIVIAIVAVNVPLIVIVNCQGGRHNSGPARLRAVVVRFRGDPAACHRHRRYEGDRQEDPRVNERDHDSTYTD
jgi:hypothetical protein